MFKFSAQPKTILKDRRQENATLKPSNAKLVVQKSKTPLLISIGEDLLPKGNQKIVDPFEYFQCDRPNVPVYVPQKTKINKGTQIPKVDWLLFNFDKEVEPVMEVLVAKILQQSKAEIAKENENLMHQDKLHRIKVCRNAEIIKTRRVLSKGQRHTIEVENRKLERDLRLSQNHSAGRKNLARRASKFIVFDKIIPTVLDALSAKHLVDLEQDAQVSILYQDVYQAGVAKEVPSLQKFNDLGSSIVEAISHGLADFHQRQVEENSKRASERRRMHNEEAQERQHKLDQRQRLAFLKAESRRKRKIELFFLKRVVLGGQVLAPDSLLNGPFVSFHEFLCKKAEKTNYVGFVFPPLTYIVYIVNSIHPQSLEDRLTSFIDSLLKSNIKALSFAVSGDFNDFFKDAFEKVKTGEGVDIAAVQQAACKEADAMFEWCPYPTEFVDKNQVVKLLLCILRMKLDYAAQLGQKRKASTVARSPSESNGTDEAQENPAIVKPEPPAEIDTSSEKLILSVCDSRGSVDKGQNFYMARIQPALSNIVKSSAGEDEVSSFRNLVSTNPYDGTLFDVKRRIYEVSADQGQPKSFSSQGYNIFVHNIAAWRKFIKAIVDAIEKQDDSSLDYEALLSRLAALESQYLHAMTKDSQKETMIFDIEDK